ncbi:uncharacterized protein LOC132718912 [Ruditapes philippinarum]|uniref:uncharacterized protein LOC132718912 n=1 Tax=Ruditapes philippinarum TaxID=129788 RepID=UPI00295A8173|nr:uncharacterized protein LOC132718912 [Ruditapes philippinarum]
MEGLVFLIIHPSGHQVTRHMVTGKHCSNLRAETEARMKAVSMIIDSTEAVSSVVFLTDARSVLEALIDNKSPDLARAMSDLSTICSVAIQWIPAHCGMTGNEETDQLVKSGAQSKQPDVQVSYKEKVTIIKAITEPRQEPDAYHSLNRPE